MALTDLNSLGSPATTQKGGGFLQSLKEFFLGTPGGFQALQNFAPDQLEALSQLLQGGLSQVQNPYGGFEPIEQQYKQQFQQETVPGLAERFTSLGGGAQRSSAFGQQLGQAGAGLSTQLAALKSQYGLQSRQQGLQQAGMGLTPRFQYANVPGSQGLLGNLMGLGAQGLGSYMGGMGYAKGLGGL